MTRVPSGGAPSSSHAEASSDGAFFVTPVEIAVEVCLKSLRHGGTIFVCGNGGSAAMASHFAAELLVKYTRWRPAIPCLNLAADTGVLTACANDFSHAYVFARQLEGLARAGDVLIPLSTSGSSANILRAREHAERFAIEILECGAKRPEETTAQCQERHLKWLHHIAAELEDAYLLQNPPVPRP